MFIYLIKNDALLKNINFEGKTAHLGSKTIYDYEGALIPHIDVSNSFGVLTQSQQLPEFFLKATEIIFPTYVSKRELGIYYFGKAKAELNTGQNCPYWLKLETDSWEGVQDMFTIQEKISAGTISPIVSYEKKQPSSSLLKFLKTFYLIFGILGILAGFCGEYKYIQNGNPLWLLLGLVLLVLATGSLWRLRKLIP